jgi:glycosyltransferase involved in cell wall biosynthesis
VVYVGVMGPQDGVDYALRAVRQYIDLGRRDALFAFLGSGECLPQLRALARQLDIEEHVVFTGWAFDETLRKYLSTATLGLAPDPKTPLNDASTMNKVIDYMAMGLPIVSFDLKESRRSAQDAAVYVHGDDERAMAVAVRDLLADPEKRRRMGDFGRKRAVDALSWEHGREALLELYGRLLPRPVSPGLDPVPRAEAVI